jgi:hypothetical protein
MWKRRSSLEADLVSCGTLGPGYPPGPNRDGRRARAPKLAGPTLASFSPSSRGSAPCGQAIGLRSSGYPSAFEVRGILVRLQLRELGSGELTRGRLLRPLPDVAGGCGALVVSFIVVAALPNWVDSVYELTDC